MKGDDVATKLRGEIVGFSGYSATHHGIGRHLMDAANEAADLLEQQMAEIASLRAELQRETAEREAWIYGHSSMLRAAEAYEAENAALRSELAELRGRGAGPVAGGGDASEAAGGPAFGTIRRVGTDDWVTVGGSDKAFVDHIARAVLAYAHPSVSAGERRIEGFIVGKGGGHYTFSPSATWGYERATLTIHDSAVLPTPTEPAK